MIIEQIKRIIDKIDTEGIEINGTKEIAGVQINNIDISDLDLLLEENMIKEYYHQIGINTQVVRSLEHNLYEFIYRGLKQSVEQLFYFDKTQDYTSRRFVFSTTDCISHVQILYRRERADLFVHMRSTDVKKLLPWDILFCCNLLNRVILECRFPMVKKRYININIASAHYYISPKTLY